MLLTNKKRNKGQRIIKEIKEGKSKEKLWEVVGKQRLKRVQVSEDIQEDEWKRHFRIQLKRKDLERRQGGEDIQQDESRKEENKDEEGDSIDTIAVNRIISTMKKKNAAGPYGIKNEASIYTKDIVIEDLVRIMNDIWMSGNLPEDWKKEPWCRSSRKVSRTRQRTTEV